MKKYDDEFKRIAELTTLNQLNDLASELISIAATLLRCDYLPPIYADDYAQKTYTSKRVASMMETAHDRSRQLAIRVREVADKLSR